MNKTSIISITVLMAALAGVAFGASKGDPSYRVPMGKVRHMDLKDSSSDTKKKTTEKSPQTVTPVQTTTTTTKKPVEPVQVQDAEYLKSVGNLNISVESFQADKNSVLNAIKDLQEIMKTWNYNKWLTYIDAESIAYWEQPSNLKKAQNKLPNKNVNLRNLRDYFTSVFIPSRQGHIVTEIRYVTDTYVKAVEIKDNKDIVCYYFNKIDGQWKVHIPSI